MLFLAIVDQEHWVFYILHKCKRIEIQMKMQLLQYSFVSLFCFFIINLTFCRDSGNILYISPCGGTYEFFRRTYS